MSKESKFHVVGDAPATGTEATQQAAKSESAQADSDPQSQSPRAQKTKPSKILQTTRISFAKQLDILRAYVAASGHSNKPVTADEVGDIIKMAGSTVAMANPFFSDIKLIRKSEEQKLNEPRKYFPSDDVVNFAKAHEWNRETAAHKLAPTIRGSWFAQALLPKLTFNPISEEEAITVLGMEASAAPEYKPQLVLLLDYMSAAGIIEREGGQVRLVRTTHASTTQAETPQAATPSHERPASEHQHGVRESPASARSGSVSTGFTQPYQGMVNFHVDVKVDMAEMAGWQADRIAAFFSGIAQVLSAKASVEREVSK